MPILKKEVSVGIKLGVGTHDALTTCPCMLRHLEMKDLLPGMSLWKESLAMFVIPVLYPCCLSVGLSAHLKRCLFFGFFLTCTEAMLR